MSGYEWSRCPRCLETRRPARWLYCPECSTELDALRAPNPKRAFRLWIVAWSINGVGILTYFLMDDPWGVILAVCCVVLSMAIGVRALAIKHGDPHADPKHTGPTGPRPDPPPAPPPPPARSCCCCGRRHR